jgi:exopolyphosphatase
MHTNGPGAEQAALRKLWPAAPGSASRLNAYLARARSALVPSPNPLQTHVFLGNEGADLDSIVSAVVLAYASDARGGGGAPVPVVNCLRSDFPLRGDALSALAAAGVGVENLVFIDEADSLANVACITLVDHNEPASHQVALASKVRGVVDHHVDSNAHRDASPRVVDMVGSCSTLVYELCPHVLRGDGLDASAAALLLCAMVIDTRNMAGGTPRDASAISSVCRDLSVSGPQCTQIFEALYERKQAQGHLATRDLLRRDYKRFEAAGRLVGISSAGICLAEWSARDCGDSHALSVDVLQTWAAEQAVDVLIVMTMYGSADNYRRELVVCPSSEKTLPLSRYDSCNVPRGAAGPNSRALCTDRAPDTIGSPLSRSICDALLSDESDLRLCRRSIPSLEGTTAAVFRQGNIARSRKWVAPLVLQCLSSWHERRSAARGV